MKKLTFALIGVGAMAIAMMVTIKWQSHPPLLTEPTATPAARADTPESVEHDETAAQVAREPVKTSAASMPTPASALSADKPSIAASFSTPLQTLVSPQASYAQKQAAWKQLRDAHQLDEVITDLERAAKADPSAAEYPATLGIAYVQKLRTLEDYRDRGILAMKADQSFDQVLELDPSNWDARFWKASSLSYWPAELNKSGEVIDNLVTLVEQQEKQTPLPHYAQTYVLLGEQYQKAGFPDDARETWRRGAALFPDNNTLREKLAGMQ